MMPTGAPRWLLDLIVWAYKGSRDAALSMLRQLGVDIDDPVTEAEADRFLKAGCPNDMSYDILDGGPPLQMTADDPLAVAIHDAIKQDPEDFQVVCIVTNKHWTRRRDFHLRTATFRADGVFDTRWGEGLSAIKELMQWPDIYLEDIRSTEDE